MNALTATVLSSTDVTRRVDSIAEAAQNLLLEMQDLAAALDGPIKPDSYTQRIIADSCLMSLMVSAGALAAVSSRLSDQLDEDGVSYDPRPFGRPRLAHPCGDA